MKRSSKYKKLLLFIGMFSMTSIQLVGMIGISELIMVLVAPLVFLSNFDALRREGMMPVLILSFLWFIGACVSDLVMKTPFPIAIRGCAFPLVTFSTILCLYVCLRRDLNNLKYLVIGIFISNILIIFFFQRHVSEGGGVVDAMEKAINFKLFWANLFTSIFTLPMQVNYFSTPSLYAIIASFGLAIYDLSVGGRSMFLIALSTCAMFTFVRRDIRKLRFLKKYTPIFIAALVVVGGAAGTAYKAAVKKGWLGEAEMMKYEQQTAGRGEGFLSLVMAGRSDFFVSAMAAVDRPILGWGSHALDYNNYQVSFAREYGSDLSLNNALRQIEMGWTPRLPMHSHLTGFWAWHGIFGLLFWGYVLYVIGLVFLRKISDYPPYFGYLAVSVPTMVWAILGSPYSQRTATCALIVVCLIVKNLKKMPMAVVGGH